MNGVVPPATEPVVADPAPIVARIGSDAVPASRPTMIR